MNRRELLLGLAAGGVITAEGLWFPGRKLISIPKTSGYPIGIIVSNNGVPVARWKESMSKTIDKNGVVIFGQNQTFSKSFDQLTFDEIFVENPYSLGPDKLSVHKEKSYKNVFNGTLSICMASDGILRLS